MNVSVIIPTYNGEKYLPKLFDMLGRQSISFETVVIDSSSEDNSMEIAKRYTNKTEVIPKSEFDHGGTRTKAGKLSNGDILVFLTQDALPADEYAIEKIVSVFDDPKIGAAYGRQLPYEEASLFGRHLRSFNYPEGSHIRIYRDKEKYGIKTVFLSDSFAAYRREALEKIGWIKDGLIGSEDSYAGAMILKNGYSLAYVSEASVYHSHNYTILQEFKRYFDIGVFYKDQLWILDEFGSAEGEGGKYIKSELSYLRKNRAYNKIPEFFARNAMKYFGYKLGRHYNLLPKKIIPYISMYSQWWSKQNQV